MFCLRFAKAQQRCPNPAPAIPLVHTELFNVVKVLCAHISRFRLADILHHGKTARFIFHACHNHIGTRRLERLINAVLQFLAKTDAKNIRPSLCMQPIRLLSDRIVFLGEEVTDASASSIVAQMLFLEAQDPVTDIQIVTGQMRKTKQRLTRILSENTGRPFAQVAADTERDNYMSAQEALAYGLIDKIIDKR